MHALLKFEGCCVIQGTVIAESLLSSAVSNARIIIEAVTEDIHIKNSMFKG